MWASTARDLTNVVNTPAIGAVTVDNGVGASAPPDVITPVLDEGDIGQVPTCMNADITALCADWSRVVEHGNVVVR
jgi:hypothetical protein